ncbi:MAG TPA: hypothetical protein VGL00_17170 [Terracidiphilus sp.]
MKRKWLLCVVALIPAALLAQVAPDRGTRPDRGEPVFKYQAFAGFAYTSLNQVNQSRYGLIGFDIELSRNFGRYFALTADGAYFPTSYASGNPGNPTVSMILGGPELHAPLYGKVSGYLRALIGGEHTGGVGVTPRVSFAGGAGGGLEYVMSPRWVIRLGGDDILSSFSVTNNSPELGNSPHRRGNARATAGVAYRF